MEAWKKRPFVLPGSSAVGAAKAWALIAAQATLATTTLLMKDILCSPPAGRLPPAACRGPDGVVVVRAWSLPHKGELRTQRLRVLVA